MGITATTSIAHVAASLADATKKQFPDLPILFGGPHCTAILENSIRECRSFDFGLYGEADNSFPQFLNILHDPQQFDSVPGLLYWDDTGILRKNPAPELETDLDRLPFPDRGKLELDNYKWSVPGKGIQRFTTIMTSRGCPFRCIFCSAHTVFGRKVRDRDIECVLDELEHCVRDHGIRHFSFIDDTLTLKHDRVRSLCRGIRERKLDITWEGWTRANTVDREILSEMKSAGFVRISFGIETAHPEILKRIKKGVPLESYKTAYDTAKALGIETRGSIILGMPGETSKTAMETLKFSKNLKGCDQIYINIATPYPATELYDIALEGRHGLKLLTHDFSQYRRYGNAVIEVNDLKTTDLVALQRKGFLMFYFMPRRIWYNFKRAGLLAFIKNAHAFVKSVIFKGAT
jgi:radical SAM superfamily enzyme YgiQ (UPF0313 family)